jgi:hypothetical protein
MVAEYQGRETTLRRKLVPKPDNSLNNKKCYVSLQPGFLKRGLAF